MRTAFIHDPLFHLDSTGNGKSAAVLSLSRESMLRQGRHVCIGKTPSTLRPLHRLIEGGDESANATIMDEVRPNLSPCHSDVIEHFDSGQRAEA